MIDDAVVSLQKTARKEFTDFFGEDVGNALATVFDIQTNVGEAPLRLGLQTASGIMELNPMRFAHDFEGAKETWSGVGDTIKYVNPTQIAMDPLGAFEHYSGQLEGLAHVEDWSTDRPGLGPAMVASEIGSMLIPGGAAARGTRAAAEAADVADAGPGVRAANAADNAISNLGGIAERGTAIENNLEDLGDNVPPGAMPEASGPPIPRDVVNTPSAPQIPEPPGSPRLPDSPAPHVPDQPTPGTPEPALGPGDRSPAPQSLAPVDRSPGPQSPTPAGVPTHAPIAQDNAGARTDAPAAPGHGQTPGGGADAEPTSPTSASADNPTAPTIPPSIDTSPQAPRGDSTADGSTPVDPGPPSSGSGPHVQPGHGGPPGDGDSGYSSPQQPGSDGPPNSTDSPNNPPHTGLHDPPANHATPGERLPDLTDINAEYRLPNGAVDPDRFDEWAQKVVDAYPAITKDGVEGVYDYTTQNYQGMNPYLRDIDPLSPQQSGILAAPSISDMTDAQRASWEARIAQTDDGLAALPPYREDPLDTTSTTWRGLHASDELLQQLKLGDTFSDPAYLSTTTDQRVAEIFARGADPDATATLITVVGRDGVDVKDLSRYMDESEILFPRGTQFEVVFRELGPDGLLRITLRQTDS